MLGLWRRIMLLVQCLWITRENNACLVCYLIYFLSYQLLFFVTKMNSLNFLVRLEGRSQEVNEEFVRLGESLVQSSEGIRAIALELCREFEDKFLQHINTGEVCLAFYSFYFHSFV